MAQLIGYALVNTCITTPLIDEAHRLLQQLRQAGQLGSDVRVALNSQLCLAVAYRGRGLMPGLVAQLSQQLAPRYEALYATVHRQNARSMRYHRREGYRQVAETPERVCFLRPITVDERPSELLAGLRLRAALPADAPALHTLNHAWTRATRGENLAEGFLTTVYSEAQFQFIIAAGEIAVAETIAP